MFGLTWTFLAYRVIAVVIYTVACFAGGYIYKAHLYQVADAARQATQQTAQVTAEAGATASDTVSISRLQSDLAASTSLTTRLLQQIKDQQNASPAADTCRLPSGLRDAINASLAAGSR